MKIRKVQLLGPLESLRPRVSVLREERLCEPGEDEELLRGHKSGDDA